MPREQSGGKTAQESARMTAANGNQGCEKERRYNFEAETALRMIADGRKEFQ
jgi:hypothetical protein